MNAEQKQRAAELLAAWRATTYALHADSMSAMLQELVDGRVLPAGTALYTAPPHQSEHHLEMVNTPAPSVPDEIPDSVIDAVAEALGDAYDCTRVWAAWSHGTMGPDDFHIIANDADRVAEIARAALTSWFAAAQTKPEPPADLVRDVRLQVESEFAALLPGVTYMDEPDGGTPTVQEQVKRMAMDAERYRWLREERFDKPYGVTDSDMTAVYEGDDLDVAIEAAIERDKKGCES